MRPGRHLLPHQLLFFLAAAACAPGAADDSEAPEADGEVPAGVFELRAALGEQRFPARLELLSVDGRPWGRLTIVAGEERVAAVRGIDGAGGAWEFDASSPVSALRLRLADTVSGELTLAGGATVSLEGRRTGDVAAPEELRAHHVLEPLGLAERAGEEGASFPTVAPDGTLIFARHGGDLSRQTLLSARSDGSGGWEDPVVLPFSGRHGDRSPALLPDGAGLLFASDRPVSSGDDGWGGELYRLWYAPRSAGGGWGEPVPVSFEGGWEADARQPSIAADGTLYFSSDAPGGLGEGDIYEAAPSDETGRWSAPRNLGEPVNGPGDEHGASLAPDGDFLLLASAGARPGRSGGDDLYVSRRTAGGWSVPEPLPLPVNTFANEYGPSISPTDGSLYFTSDRYGDARLLRVEAGEAGLP